MIAALQNTVKESLETTLNKSGDVKNIKHMAGGSINEAWSFDYAGERYFAKVNDARAFPKMFEKESLGLSLLGKNSSLVIPRLIFQKEAGQKQVIVMSYLDKSNQTENYWEAMGRGIARLHRKHEVYFGLDHDNYIGSLNQSNGKKDNFGEFFVTRRIEPLLSAAIDEKYFDKSISRNFERFFSKLNELFPREPSSLLHGDLWNGNIMSSINGPAIFDPAVYYGHREADLAMTKLFGGFHSLFYESYVNEFSPEKGWESRVDLHNLYPLLVHVNLFGGGYVYDVKSIITRF